MYSLSSGPGEASEWYWMVSSGIIAVTQTLHRAVVYVHLSNLQTAFDRIAVHGIAVVLGGDVDPTSRQVLYRVIGPTVSELELEGSRP